MDFLCVQPQTSWVYGIILLTDAITILGWNPATGSCTRSWCAYAAHVPKRVFGFVKLRYASKMWQKQFLLAIPFKCFFKSKTEWQQKLASWFAQWLQSIACAISVTMCYAPWLHSKSSYTYHSNQCSKWCFAAFCIYFFKSNGSMLKFFILGRLNKWKRNMTLICHVYICK